MILNERSKAATQTSTPQPDEVALHRAALTAVEQARAQIHLARHYAGQLGNHAVGFDVRAKIESAFDEPLPGFTAGHQEPSSGRQPMLFMIDDRDRLPALKETVERYVPTARPTDEASSPRALLRQAIDDQGGLWSASRAFTFLTEAGWRSESERPENVVGNILATMARDGEIQRTGRGMYMSNRPPTATAAEQEVAPGVLAREASPGVWVLTGLVDGPAISEASATV